MSRSYMVLFVSPDQDGSVDGMEAEVFMRFTEPPTDEFLKRLADEQPGVRVYSLMGASTWHESNGVR